MTSASLWPAPKPLLGAKSKKRAIFQVDSAEVAVSGEACRVEGLTLTLESRCAAVGEAGRAAVALLLREAEPEKGTVTHHPDLEIAYLGPRALPEQSDKEGYLAAIDLVLQRCPQVVVLDEASGAGDAWAQAYGAVLSGEAIKSFAGAVVLCVAEEMPAFAHLCKHCWVRVAGCLREEPCSEVIEDALAASENDSSVRALLEEVDQLGHSSWIELAKEKGYSVTLFAKTWPCGATELRGFLCHHMFAPPRAEFHVKFVLVPPCHRGRGYGKWIILWVLARAAQLPESQCRWISLQAYDDKVPFYEKLGFTDLGSGPNELEETWMEIKNYSVVSEVTENCLK